MGNRRGLHAHFCTMDNYEEIHLLRLITESIGWRYDVPHIKTYQMDNEVDVNNLNIKLKDESEKTQIAMAKMMSGNEIIAVYITKKETKAYGISLKDHEHTVIPRDMCIDIMCPVILYRYNEFNKLN